MINIHAEGTLSAISRKWLEIQLHFGFPAAKCQYIKNFKRDGFAVRAGWMAEKIPLYIHVLCLYFVKTFIIISTATFSCILFSLHLLYWQHLHNKYLGLIPWNCTQIT